MNECLFLLVFRYVFEKLSRLAAWLTALLLNRYRVSRFFWYPPLVFLALTVVYTTLVSSFIVPR